MQRFVNNCTNAMSDALTSSDPIVPDWQNIELPDTWADEFNLANPLHLIKFIKTVKSDDRQAVNLPDNLMGSEKIPKYVRQEFHSLPNGNYSNTISHGYITGFDISMLGMVNTARKTLISHCNNAKSLLDVGCGGGKTALAAQQSGIQDVWGLDPSPYLLRHTARRYPEIKFVQGVAEKTDFPNQRFDAITACFVFHEIPPKYSNQALTEFHRILKPGGTVAIAEPSPIQIQQGYWQLLKTYGLKGPYFKALANRVFEPFLNAWHQKSYATWFAEHGFELVEDNNDCPIRILVARKV